MQGRVDAAVTSKKGKKSVKADGEMREEDSWATSAKSKKAKSSKGVYQEPKRLRRKGVRTRRLISDQDALSVSVEGTLCHDRSLCARRKNYLMHIQLVAISDVA
jgi:hypothetical protein